ncbi:MAG: right-handed parallel beta-helix repeat-containing protein, partial [Sedimentisphaerales bacterium]|nr:right-handed parallel beta-helix repeat-containing protein [Sedimentisphaerales bacterium]
ITFCSRVAGYFRGDGLTIRHCLFSDTSTEGVYVIGSSDVLLERNIFGRNNIEEIMGYFPSAVKIFNQSHRVTCRDNLVIDNPNSNGIWYDVGNQDGIFINNWVQDCQVGFFFEISKGAICAGNVFVNCSNGIRVLNSCDVQVYQNTLINSRVSFGRDSRSAAGDHFGWHASTGPEIEERDGHVFVNNLLAVNEQFRGQFLQYRQPGYMSERFKQPQVEKLDYNVYVRVSSSNTQPLTSQSPVAEGNRGMNFQLSGDSDELKSEFSTNSLTFDNYDGPLFKCALLSNYELLEAFPGSKIASPLPNEISKLLGWQKQESRFPGAYPLCP